MSIDIKQFLQLMRRQAKVAAAFAAGVIVSGAGAVLVGALVPDANNVIHGCYSSSARGNLRVIDSPGQSCGTGETAIDWGKNGIGPTGGFISSLVNADLRDANLPSRNFANVDMHGANLAGALLSGSDFRGANLSGSNFDNVRAQNANFHGVNLRGAQVTWGDMANSDITGADFTNANIFYGPSGGDFRGSNFTGVVLLGGGFNAANLSGVDFSHIIVGGDINFSEVNFSGANLSSLDFSVEGKRVGRFAGSNLAGANFTGVKFARTEFSGNNYIGANFSGAHFTDSVNFRGEDLRGAILTDTTWDTVSCPDNTESIDNGNTCMGHLAP